MSKNCPYCLPEPGEQPQPWGMSPESMASVKRSHDLNHCFKCPTCGHAIQKENPDLLTKR